MFDLVPFYVTIYFFLLWLIEENAVKNWTLFQIKTKRERETYLKLFWKRNRERVEGGNDQLVFELKIIKLIRTDWINSAKETKRKYHNPPQKIINLNLLELRIVWWFSCFLEPESG